MKKLIVSEFGEQYVDLNAEEIAQREKMLLKQNKID